MRLLKRVILIIVLLVVATGLWIGIQITRPKTDESVSVLDTWVAGQVVGVVNRYLEPAFEMESFSFRLPGTFTARNIRMTAADPGNPGKTIDIIEAETLVVELAEVPRKGQPIRIREIEIQGGAVRLVSVSGTDRSLVGFSDLVRPSPETPTGSDASTTTLSEVLRIQRVALDDVTIVRDSRLPGLQPMQLTGIDVGLDVKSGSGGVYGFDTKLTQGPVFQASAAGTFDIDATTLVLESVAMETTLDDSTMGYLPPNVQDWVKTYAIKGRMKVTGHGTLGANVATSLKAQLSLTDTNFATGPLQFPMKTFDAKLVFDDENLTVSDATAKMLGGTVQAQGTVGLRESGGLDVACRLRDIRLEEMITAFAEDPTIEPAYRGRVRADATWKTPYSAILTETSGGGRIKIDEGTLTQLPIIKELTDAIVGVAKVALIDVKPADTADMRIDFEGDHVRFSDTRIVTDVMTVHGGGTLGYDGQVDGVANGGPLEKVQSMLGGIGDVFGAISDSLAHYTIRGPVDDAAVHLQAGPAPKIVKE